MEAFPLLRRGEQGRMAIRPDSNNGSVRLPHRRLRIALLSYRSNPYSGGQGIYVKHLSRALVEAGHQVDVISGEPYPDLDPRVGLIPLPGMNFYAYARPSQAIRERGLRSWSDVREWLSYNSGGFPEPEAFGRRASQYLALHGRSYDIIHDNQSLSYGLLQLMRSGHPVLATMHHPITRDLRFALEREPNWGLRLLLRRWHGFLKMQKKVAPKLPKIIAVSEASKQDIQQDFRVDPCRVEVVHNGVDTATFAPIPEMEPEPCRIMATASADVPLKGLHVLLQAVASLVDELPDISLTVLGKPKGNGPTTRLIAELGLQDRIRFVSGLTDQEIALEYARSSLAAVPSLYEGFGLPAAEAMACAKPVVSSSGGALPEVVGSAGVLVPPGDAAPLATAIRRLLKHPDQANELGRRARRRMERAFTWTRAAQQTLQAYGSLLASFRPPARRGLALTSSTRAASRGTAC